MNKPMLTILGAASLALGGCGTEPVKLQPTGGDTPVVTGGAEPIPAVAQPSPTSPVAGEPLPGAPGVDTGTPGDNGAPSELRLVGLNTAGFSSVLLPVVSVRVTAGDREVAFQPTLWGHVDVAGSGQAQVLGTFGVPEGVSRVQVELALGQFGAVEDATGAGPLDTRVMPLRFEVRTRTLKLGEPVVLSLDVARSVVTYEGRRILLPQLTVKD